MRLPIVSYLAFVDRLFHEDWIPSAQRTPWIASRFCLFGQCIPKNKFKMTRNSRDSKKFIEASVPAREKSVGCKTVEPGQPHTLIRLPIFACRHIHRNYSTSSYSSFSSFPVLHIKCSYFLFPSFLLSLDQFALYQSWAGWDCQSCAGGRWCCCLGGTTAHLDQMFHHTHL